MTIIIDGKPHEALVSCHHTGRFTYYDGERWVMNALTVHRGILDQLPESERLRVRSRMAENGVSPS